MAYSNRTSAGTVWLPTGNPDTTNISSADFNGQGGQPGSLGAVFEASVPNRRYQRVLLDSGATSATPVGAVAANEIAYWKDKGNYIVTNDSRFAMGGPATAYRNYVAGVFRSSSLTAGNYIDVLQSGQNIPCKDGGNTFAAGEPVIAESDTTAAAFDRVGIGTAPTTMQVGIARGAASGGNVNVDIDIPSAQ